MMSCPKVLSTDGLKSASQGKQVRGNGGHGGGFSPHPIDFHPPHCSSFWSSTNQGKRPKRTIGEFQPARCRIGSMGRGGKRHEGRAGVRIGRLDLGQAYAGGSKRRKGRTKEKEERSRESESKKKKRKRIAYEAEQPAHKPRELQSLPKMKSCCFGSLGLRLEDLEPDFGIAGDESRLDDGFVIWREKKTGLKPRRTVERANTRKGGRRRLWIQVMRGGLALSMVQVKERK